MRFSLSVLTAQGKWLWYCSLFTANRYVMHSTYGQDKELPSRKSPSTLLFLPAAKIDKKRFRRTPYRPHPPVQPPLRNPPGPLAYQVAPRIAFKPARDGVRHGPMWPVLPVPAGGILIGQFVS